MKKVIYAFALLAAVAAAFTGCKKDGDDTKVVKRLVSCGDKWDVYSVSYNADGTINAVQRNYDETKQVWEKEWLFTWNGKNATAEYKEKGVKKGDRDQTFTFGDNGFLSSYANHWGDTFTFTYEDGYLKNIKYKNADKCNCVWENGNLVKWSRFVEKKDEDGNKVKDENGNQVYEEEWKIQTFTTEKNTFGIFPDATDKADVQRWMFEVGYVGKASKNLLDQAAWKDAEKAAVHTYTKDADGYVTEVSKVYGTDEPELYYYQWEKVEK